MYIHIAIHNLEQAKLQCEKMGLHLSGNPKTKPSANSAGYDSTYDISTTNGIIVGEYTQYSKSHLYKTLQDSFLINKQLYIENRNLP